MDYNYNQNYLAHHGVKGMKWGVRRFQNEDGSLTPAGQKRYSSMSNDKLQKTLYKQVRKAREEQYGWSDQWRTDRTIGKYSKAAQEKFLKDRKEHEKSEPVKQALKELNRLNIKYDTGKIDLDEYVSEFTKLEHIIDIPEFNRSTIYSSGIGRQYTEVYLNKYGKDLTIGYLRDLGYNESVAKEFTKRVFKSNKKMIN